jgi:transposase
MQAYSTDLCERVAAARASGSTLAAVAARFQVSISFVHKGQQRQHVRGTVAALPPRGGSAPLLTQAAQLLLGACLRQPPDATLDALRRRLVAVGGPAVSRATLGRAVQRLGWRRKKNRCTPPNATPSG